MKIGVCGTGMVGKSIATKLVALGHDVKMGARSATNEKAAEWAGAVSGDSSQGTFADAADHGEVLFLCVKGEHALAVLESVGADRLSGSVLVDLTNPLDFSNGMPPTLSVCNDDSLGERIQAAYSGARVVKTLNTLNADLMVDPGALADGDHSLFICGDDTAAKATVMTILTEGFGWKDVIDLGGIAQARGLEMWLPLWIRLWGTLGSPSFNLKIVR